MKSSVPYVITFLFISFTFIRVSSVNASTNYAPNPSYEQGTINPDHWQMQTSNACNNEVSNSNATFFWDDKNSLSGSKSLALENISWNNNSNIPETWMTAPQVYESGVYEIIVYAKDGKNNLNISPAFKICTYREDPNIPPYAFKIRSRKTNISVEGWNGYYLEVPFQNSSVDHLGKPMKISVGISAQCIENMPCSGSLWFDDISLKRIGALKAGKFQDTNGNGVKDSGEYTISRWEMSLFEKPDCQGQPIKRDVTTTNGEAFFYAPVGVNSVLEETRPNFINITPLCQNVTVGELLTTPEAKIVFANKPFFAPTFPYLSQLDPVWSAQEYDHGNSIGPFFCGTTIGGCGCAITSSAMLLKYHGATKSPTGEETNPATLNNWLKNNSGYAFGALKWNSVAAYSVKANQAFGTQKIRFAGTGSANNFLILNTDLANSKPAILEEPGHFIVAKAKQGSTYTIADPAFSTRTTLDSYSNNFSSFRRFEKTSTDLSAIYISTPAPNDVFITDSLGRKAGKDSQTSQTYTEIPNSYYFLEPSLLNQSQASPQTPPEGSGVNTLVIINPSQDTYSLQSGQGKLDISAYDTQGNISDQTFSPASTESFDLNYSPQDVANFEVLQKIQIKAIPEKKIEKAPLISVFVQPDKNFNTEDIDLDSLKFGPGNALPINKKPIYIPQPKTKQKQLLVFFWGKDAKIQKGDKVCLIGKTKDGVNFKGCL